MSVYIHPDSGVLEKHSQYPGPPWREVSGAGTLLRTVTDGGTWIAARHHYLRVHEVMNEGWELVNWKRPPRPVDWRTGPLSELAFGFAQLTPIETSSIGCRNGVAVVLPGEPGEQSPAYCPGSRYHFEIGMLAHGAPADYLVEKLLSFRTRRLGLGIGSLGFRKLSPWQEEQVERLMILATQLSDDISQAARVEFGSDHEYMAWSRRKQWQVAKERKR